MNFLRNITRPFSLLYDWKLLRKILIFLLVFICIYSFIFDRHRVRRILFKYLPIQQEYQYNISPNVQLVDLYETTKNTKFRCVKTKPLLHNISTNVCLYDTKRDRYVSGAFSEITSIWEEEQVTRLLQYLVRHPHMHFIDIGANIGTYTMYVATLGRFVLAIDCFAPNLVRLRRAIQMRNLYNQVVLVQNAIFNHSGQYLRLSIDTTNVGGQSIHPSRNYHGKTNLPIVNPYIVKTITFDEVLPILLAHAIRSVSIKMDIEGSESFVFKTGHRIFDTLDIPLIQMEWKIVHQDANQVKIIIEFLNQRHYIPINNQCKVLDLQENTSWPDEIYWLKRNAPTFC